MPIINVNLIDTFDQWRIKTNTISNSFGDLSLLTTTENSNVVSAVNELKGIVDAASNKISEIVQDPSPELGGDLDLNSNNMVGIGNINITGTITGTINLGGALTGTVDNAQIATDSVTTNKLADDAVSTSKLFNNAVTTVKLADDAVTSDKVSDLAITTDKLSDGSVTATKVATNSIGISELNVSDGSNGQYLSTDGSGNLSFISDTSNLANTPVGGDLTGTVSNAQIADDSVTDTKIAYNAVTDNNIADGSVTHPKLATDSVEEDNIKNNAVTTTKINNGAITDDKITSVDASKLFGTLPAGMGGGKVLQVVNFVDNQNSSTTSQTFVDTTLQASIQPSSSTSKIAIFLSYYYSSSWYAADNNDPGPVFRLFRDTAQLSHDITVGHDSANYSADAGHGYSFNFLDSPDTTAMVYYCLKYRTQGTGGQSVFYNRGAHLNATNENGGTAVSSIMLMELDFA